MTRYWLGNRAILCPMTTETTAYTQLYARLIAFGDLRPLTEEDLRLLPLLHLKTNEVFKLPTDTGCFVASGYFTATRFHYSSGRTRACAVFQPNDFYFPITPAYELVALQPLTLVSLPASRIYTALDLHPHLLPLLVHVLLAPLQRFSAAIDLLLLHQGSERLQLLQEQRPELFQQLPGYVIADILGISREHYTRLRK